MTTIRQLLADGTITMDTVVHGTLPLTADGRIYGAGSPICWRPCLVGGVTKRYTTLNGENGGHRPHEVYSTREAAEAARKETP